MFVDPRESSRDVWTGTRLGTAGVSKLTGIPARTIDQLQPTLDSLLATGMALSRIADRPSFSTIVGSGPNSTTLHYNSDDRFMNAGEMVVMDIGASYGGYAADVTRTVPVSGVFTPDQRAIYQLVRDAQAAAERQAKVGGSSRALSDSARVTLGVGLAKLGLIEAPDAMYDCSASQTGGPPAQCSQLSMYYMHSPRGPHRGRLHGHRQGVEWISRAPREIAQIEALMKEKFAGRGPRNAEIVNGYRSLLQVP